MYSSHAGYYQDNESAKLFCFSHSDDMIGRQSYDIIYLGYRSILGVHATMPLQRWYIVDRYWKCCWHRFGSKLDAADGAHESFCMKLDAADGAHESFCMKLDAADGAHESFCIKLEAADGAHESFCINLYAADGVHDSFCILLLVYPVIDIKLKLQIILCGMWVLPVLPFCTD